MYKIKLHGVLNRVIQKHQFKSHMTLTWLLTLVALHHVSLELMFLYHFMKRPKDHPFTLLTSSCLITAHTKT